MVWPTMLALFWRVAVEQAHLVHGVEQLAMRRLEAVDLGERTRNVGAHGVGHVVRFERFRDGLLRYLGVQADNVRVINVLLLRALFWFSSLPRFPLETSSGLVRWFKYLAGFAPAYALLQVKLIEILFAMFGNVALAPFIVVAQQQVEHGFHRSKRLPAPP